MSRLSFSRLQRGIRNPKLFLREANRLYHRRLYKRPYNTTGVDIFEQDWDNLIILDACRYDMFAEQADLPGQLESQISRSSSTVEFLEANFNGQDLRDTVYVTGNPQLYRHRNDIDVSIHAIINVWQDEGWDEENKTVMPEVMKDRTLAAAEQYPNKRIISHFIQPHYPFLIDDEVFDDNQAFLRPDEAGCWYQVMTGKLSVSKEAVWQAYQSTLDRALPAVEKLLEDLSGKTVVTADHGNMVGERAQPIPISEWGHPHGIYTEQLVKVPWLEVDGDRKKIIAEESTKEENTVTDDVVAERLEQLGYT